MAKIKLGKRYRDTLSGYEGTATSRTEYLYGCVRVLLEAGNDKSEPQDFFFDEQRLEEISGRKPTPTAKTGGPPTREPSRTGH